MIAEPILRAIRNGPRGFPVGEGYGTIAWFGGALLWWRLWALALLAVATLELAFRAMVTLDDGLAVLAILALGYALSDLGDRVAPPENRS